MRNSALILLVVFFIEACSTNQSSNSEEKDSPREKVQNSDDFKFPEVDSLSNFPNTDFVMTLDEKIDDQKNYMYAATMAFCWDGMKKRFNNKIVVDPSAELLHRLHIFDKHQKSLKDNEYKVSIEIDEENRQTKVHAEFTKTLPFQEPMFRFPDPMIFKEEKVEQFGFNGDWGYTYINFYEKNKYSLTINPLNDEHQIFLFYNGESNYENFSQAYDSMINYYEEFRQNSNIPSWKKHFEYYDEVRIPVISFNIVSTIKELIGHEFLANNSLHEIIDAWQRNAFVFNENGAKVESEAAATEEAAEAEEEEELEQPSPKLFHFNKPFYIFLKRNDAEYPYFALYINNLELFLKK